MLCVRNPSKDTFTVKSSNLVGFIVPVCVIGKDRFASFVDPSLFDSRKPIPCDIDSVLDLFQCPPFDWKNPNKYQEDNSININFREIYKTSRKHGNLLRYVHRYDISKTLPNDFQHGDRQKNHTLYFGTEKNEQWKWIIQYEKFKAITCEKCEKRFDIPSKLKKHRCY